QQLQSGRDLTLTHSLMTRFFLTINEAIELLLKAARSAIGGEMFVMKVKACRITAIADALAEHYLGHTVPLQEIGMRPGEQLHEVLVARYESPYAYTYNEQYFVIPPSHPPALLSRQDHPLPRVSLDGYHPNDRLITRREIVDLLREGGFLSC